MDVIISEFLSRVVKEYTPGVKRNVVIKTFGSCSFDIISRSEISFIEDQKGYKSFSKKSFYKVFGNSRSFIKFSDHYVMKNAIIDSEFNCKACITITHKHLSYYELTRKLNYERVLKCVNLHIHYSLLQIKFFSTLIYELAPYINIIIETEDCLWEKLIFKTNLKELVQKREGYGRTSDGKNIKVNYNLLSAQGIFGAKEL